MELSFPEPISFIIGENGIGKSTFVRCLCGLNKKFKGTTWLNQEKIRDFSKKVAWSCKMSITNSLAIASGKSSL